MPRKGQKVTKEQKQKISATLKQKYASGEIVPAMKGKTHSEETLKKLAQYKGEKNSQYGVHWTEARKQKSARTRLKNNNTQSQVMLRRTEAQRRTQLTKAWLTKKKNGTVKSSKAEENLYRMLLEKNKTKTIYRNYKSECYPFYCDFYIKEDDLYIELNAHWTHGGMPYDKNNPECQKKLELWKEKAKTSQFYENAIYTWTVRDVEKQKIAKENNLNYKVIY